MRMWVDGWISVHARAALILSFTIPQLAVAQRVAHSYVSSGESRSVIKTQTKVISLAFDQVTVREALDAIARECMLALSFAGDDAHLKTKLTARVSVKFNNTPLEDALSRIMQTTGYYALVSDDGRAIMITKTKPRGGEKGAIADGILTGRITDSTNGQGIFGVTIALAELQLSTTTNERGEFTLKDLPPGTYTVTIKIFGYRTTTRRITVTKDQPSAVRITLTPVQTVLSGVVTTATGKQQKLEVGNSITTINVDSVMQVAPVTSLTDLLETRVPGLQIVRSSGNPGDPKRVRLRGSSSINRNNDPIVVVDGMRMYAAQSDSRNRNMARASDVDYLGPSSLSLPEQYAAPSPLDQIDVNNIETIEVFNGPSAAALYGSDAANGVIVITTKRGRAGPTYLSVTAERGITKLPGRYETNFFRWGHQYNSVSRLYSVFPDEYGYILDSITAYQALNDARYTPLTDGANGSGSATISGGGGVLNYSFTTSLGSETGLFRLPMIEAIRFERNHGRKPPTWMQRPNHYRTWSGSGNVSAQPGKNATISYQTSLFRSTQQRSSLENSLRSLMGRYIDTSTFDTEPLIPAYYERATANQLSVQNGVNLQWRPYTWLSINGTGGISILMNEDETVMPRGYNLSGPDSTGRYSARQGTAIMKTVNFAFGIPIPIWTNKHIETAFGVNVVQGGTSDAMVSTEELKPGEMIPATFVEPVATKTSQSSTTFGWFFEPKFNFNSRFFVTPGFRLDGGSSNGSRARFNGLPRGLSFSSLFPKVNFSWLASDEPRFPFKHIFSLIRLRLAYGHAGVQPDASARLRLFRLERGVVDDQDRMDILRISTIGNTELRPERSTEVDGGFDIAVWDDRIQLGLSQYRKRRVDAIVGIPTAPSVGMGGGKMQRNIGVVDNSGTELNLNAQLLQSGPLSWNLDLNYGSTNNQVKRLARGEAVIVLSETSRIVPGYPLFSRWERPIISYADENGDGIIRQNEVRIGDSLVYVGQQEPKYTMNASSTVTLLNGAASINASVSYVNGQTQVNAGGVGSIIRRADNPDVTPAEQAALAVIYGNKRTTYGLIQTVHTLRLQSLSFNYTIPTRLSQRLLKVPVTTLSLQGSNLGLRTNYHGLDPNVNALSTGNEVMDGGQLPTPKKWQLRIRLSR